MTRELTKKKTVGRKLNKMKEPTEWLYDTFQVPKPLKISKNNTYKSKKMETYGFLGSECQPKEILNV